MTFVVDQSVGPEPYIQNCRLFWMRTCVRSWALLLSNLFVRQGYVISYPFVIHTGERYYSLDAIMQNK